MPSKSRKQRTTGSSFRAAHVSTARTPFGPISQATQYDARALREEYDQEMYKASQRHVDQRINEEREKMQRLSGTSDMGATSGDSETFIPSLPLEPEDVLSGGVPLDISHAGGELLSILLDESDAHQSPSYTEWRTRRDHVENRNKAFKLQLPFIIQAYLEWEVSLGDAGLEGACPRFTMLSPTQPGIRLRIMDMFWTQVQQTDIVDGPEGVPAAFVRRGLIPCAPIRPSLAVSTRLLEFYHNTHLRCPHLSMQASVQSLCDTHRIVFNPYLSTQFSIAYDLFLQIRNTISRQVQQALGRDTPDWRLRNACPACTYRLKDEDSMIYTMLVTMDGNDSLKRVIRRSVFENPEGDVTTISKETLDTRTVNGDYYLDRETVDRWAKDRVMDAIREGNVDTDNPCASRWTNMANEVTARMWGVFDETGIFLVLCRHGFALLVADMVRSGELAKYPLAMVEKLLNTFGAGIGVGYDIGCWFGATLAQSELGDQVREMRLKSLVGAFHGHAHNRLCQLSNLTTYMEGLGLEDLEGCERFFSKSNALASSVRYASVFHRWQHIMEYMKHLDVAETSQNLSEFLVNNYKQALQILAGKADLYEAMERAGITDVGVFKGWLKDEQEYLLGRSKEPEVETSHIDYYRALVKLHLLEDEIRNQQTNFIAYQPPTTTPGHGNQGKRPRQNQTHGIRLMHAREQHEKTLEKVQDLERMLDILPGDRWTPGSTLWNQAATLFNHQHYQRCLDELESLVVSRLFELTKMNMSQTGYKLRKHIGAALRQRSQAIRNAIDRYNKAAGEMSPPRDKLTWDKVVDYAFLTDFSLLCDCREDITQRPWARPHSRALMDQYFKIVRAHEELERVNIEIRHVITYLHDEDKFLRLMESKLSQSNPLIAHQIKLLRLKTMRFKDLHMRRFLKLARTPEFSGTILPGESLDRSQHVDQEVDDGDSMPSTWDAQGEEDDGCASEGDFEESEACQLEGMDQRYSLLASIIHLESSSGTL